MDSLRSNLTNFLSQHESIKDVQVSQEPGVNDSEIDEWNRENEPCELPQDVVSFLCAQNGLDLKWFVSYSDEYLRLGTIHINAIKHIAALTIEPNTHVFSVAQAVTALRRCCGSSTHGHKLEEDENTPHPNQRYSLYKDVSPSVLKDPVIHRMSLDMLPVYDQLFTNTIDSSMYGTIMYAYELDSFTHKGTVALVYMLEPGAEDVSNIMNVQEPCVCYRDIDGIWYLVANSFSEYVRLMVLHLGLPDWLTAFTANGLTQSCATWLGFFAPERRAMDTQAFDLLGNGPVAEPVLPHVFAKAAATAAAAAAAASPVSKPMPGLSSASMDVMQALHLSSGGSDAMNASLAGRNAVDMASLLLYGHKSEPLRSDAGTGTGIGSGSGSDSKRESEHEKAVLRHLQEQLHNRYAPMFERAAEAQRSIDIVAIDKAVEAAQKPKTTARTSSRKSTNSKVSRLSRLSRAKSASGTRRSRSSSRLG
jgi:tubulin polyglutamylase complex subunit 2